MKEYNSESLRNITLIGHGGSGKTSLSEVFLFTAGELNRIGKVDEGNTTSDFNANEIEKKISINASAMHFEWNNTKINLIDTPGYSDFVGQVNAGLHVADTAVSVVKSAEGIEVGTEQTWSFVRELNIPSSVIINKCDNEHSKFFETFEMVKNRLSSDAIVVTFPANEGLNFNCVIDLVTMKATTYGEAGSKKATEEDIPANLKDKAEELREALIEKIAESDEELMNKYFEEGALSEEDITKGLRKAIVSNSLVPVFALSASKTSGINNFLNFVSKFFPNPVERKPFVATKDGKEIEVKCDNNAPASLLVFKSLNEQHLGELSIFKVCSGSVGAGVDLINMKNNKPERIGQVFLLNGKNRKEVSKLNAGDIGAVVKLKDTHTNDTLSVKEFGAEISKVKFPEPVINAAIKPHAKGDEDKIATGLNTMHQEDPSLIVKFDPELSQTIVFGQGELQLDLAKKLLKDRYNVEIDLVEPKIPYRETIKGRCDNSEYKHKKQSGGRGQYGHVVLKLEPLARGTGFQFEDAIVGGVVPGRFIPAVEKGINEVMGKGILTSSKVIDIKATLFFGSYHDVDSDEVSFKIAASQAFKKGFKEADPVILEPIYEINIKVPEECMGDVMGDVSSRRGKILGMDSEGPFQIIKAMVPLAQLYKYATHLRSLTGGRGIHSRKFSHYEAVPKDVEAKIIEQFQKEKEEE